MDEYSGYDEYGQAMYRNTADGAQCTRCDQLGGEHADGCINKDED